MKRCIAVSIMLLTLVIAGEIAAQGPPPTRGDAELEALLAEKAKIGIDLPELGYRWRDEDVTGDASQGSITVQHTKVIYYFVHWGPIEVPEITEEYARERVPRVWPSEGLKVGKVAPSSVAGHPAVYVEAVPQSGIYHAFFIIWNCPESGRQLIADMNYNVIRNTPRSALEAELDTTRKTLACHPGAPVSEVPGHLIHYDNPRYGLSFSHPPNWYVQDSPYGVSHPAYQGLRDAGIGSILAWLQDREVYLQFQWSSRPESEQGSQAMNLIRLAAQRALELEGIADFDTESYETLRIGKHPVVKVTGTATLEPPERKGLGMSPSSRLMMLVAEDEEADRLLVVSVQIDYYKKDGLFYPPDRSILDHWAVDIAKGLNLKP